MCICLTAYYSRHNAPADVRFTPLFLLLLLAFTAAVSPAQAQKAIRVRPAFEPKLVKRQTVSGIVRFRIVPRRDGLPHEFAPIGFGGWAAVIRVNGHILASRTRLPAVVEWDTRAAGDGVHEVHVAVRNERGDQEVGVEGAQIIVDNAAADTAAEAAATSPAAVSQNTPVDHVSHALVLPQSAKVRSLPARFSRSPNAFATRATSLLRAGSRLYMGLPDGGIKFCTADAGPKQSTSVIRLPISEDNVQSIAAGSGRVWWTTKAGRAVYAFSESSHSVTRYDVTASAVRLPEATTTAEVETEVVNPTGDSSTMPPSALPDTPIEAPPMSSPPPVPTGWVRNVVILRGHVLLIGDAGNIRVLDPASGNLTDAASVKGLLPEEIVTTEGGAARLYIAASRDGAKSSAMAVSVAPSPLPEFEPGESNETTVQAVAFSSRKRAAERWRRYRLRAWRSGSDGEWRPVASFATDADPARFACLAVSSRTVATAEREGLRVINASNDGTYPQDIPYSLSPGMPSSTDRITVGVGGLWWEQRGIIFRADLSTGARDAFLPWNVANEMGAVFALAADDNGVWIATTSAGVRYIRLGRPSAIDGYNGYVRARLGSSTLRPPTARASRVAGAIEAWQGVPYVWGGQSRSGADCSGFVMRMHQIGGVSIPRTSVGMRHSSGGMRVRDELRWGDTLVFPGHCAIYIGDGRTAETVGGTRGGSVSHSSIWVRSSVVVRRFLR
jgi:hypothetical protein